MVSLRIHGTAKSFSHPTYGFQHLSTININWSPINAHQFNNQKDCTQINSETNKCPHRDLNRGPSWLKESALPTELSITFLSAQEQHASFCPLWSRLIHISSIQWVVFALAHFKSEWQWVDFDSLPAAALEHHLPLYET